MCVIIKLEGGQSIPMNMLENACYNNWHSYGLVTMVDDKMDIVKVVPESGEVDPEEVYDLLEANKEYRRYLHLRHNTAGATNLENTHPFDVYYDPKTGRQRVFMHNGTMYSYKSKKTTDTGVTVDDDDGPSDTKNYVDEVLIPFLASVSGDIKTPIIRKALSNFWPTGDNRGVIISNDQGDLFTGTWKTIKPFENDEDTWFTASNDLYFDRCKRGPEYDRREEKAKLERQNSFQESASKCDTLKEFKISETHGFYELSDSMSDLLSDWDLYDREHAVNLGMATADELEELYKHKTDFITVFEWIASDYYTLYQQFLDIEEKHNKATKRIATLVADLKAAKEKSKKGKAA